MKTFFIIIVAFVTLLNNTVAQQDSLNIKDIEIPTSPAFVLLDQAPSSIERPNTTKAFTASVLNSFSEANGFPKNYAVEFTPFWFVKQKKMDALKYLGYNSKSDRMNPFSALKKATISLAFVNTTDTLTKKPISNVAFGIRTNLLKFYKNGYKDNLSKANIIVYKKLRGVASALQIAGATPKLKVSDTAKYNSIVKKTLAILEKDSIPELMKLVAEKPLFAIDGAVAYNTFFLNNDFSTNRFGRFGAWLTADLAIKINNENTNYFHLYLVGRYLADGMMKDKLGEYQRQEFKDFGGKLELEFKRFSLAYEYINRTDKANTNNYRSTGQFRYMVAENIYITGAFGKNFGKTNNLATFLGVNWGLTTGNEKLKL
jgi:hypothetical protein